MTSQPLRSNAPTIKISSGDDWAYARDEKKMASPLGSPTLAASAAKLRNRMPAQMRRCLPLYVTCLCFVLLFLNADFLGLSFSRNVFKRQQGYQKTLVHGASFPQKIWQTWKVDPLEFEERDSNNAKTWLDKNPTMRYEVLTDANELAYVQDKFGPDGFNRPDIVDFYANVDLPIIKADLMRYMIMYAEGGVYADIDVEALRPVSRFIPDRYDERDIDMIVGVEIDQPQWKDHPILGKKSMSFCQWTFVSRPQQPVMLQLIENIMAWLTAIAKKQGVSLGEVELDFDQVIAGTGPTAFTEAILVEMNKLVTGPQVTWDMFHDMDESKVVGRVLVLSIEAFCAGQGHSDSGTHDARGALVRHHYHASNWPSRHPRFSHPAYGQVEDCNWNTDCVNQWDSNVAAFDRLTDEEKQAKIDERNRRLAEEE